MIHRAPYLHLLYSQSFINQMFNTIKIQNKSTLEIHNWIMDLHHYIYGAP